MNLREAAQQALEALEGRAVNRYMERLDETIAALRTALAESEQIEVLTCHACGASHEHYTQPPQRKPLTDEEILSDEVLRYHFGCNGGAGPVSQKGIKIIRAVERAHGIGEKT